MANAASLGNSAHLAPYPEAELLFPFAESLAGIEVSISRAPTRLDADLKLKTLDGTEFQPQVSADLSKEPILLSLDLGSFILPVAEVAVFLPPNLPVPDGIDEIELAQVSASGPLGRWEEWKLQAATQLQIESLYFESNDVRLDGIEAGLNLTRQGSRWEGSGRIAVREAYMPFVPAPIRGLTAGEARFELAEGAAFTVRSDWTADDLLGSVFRGSLESGAGGALDVQGKSTRFQPGKLGLNVKGDWEVSLRARRSSGQSPFQITLDSSTQSFAPDDWSLPANPLTVRLAGETSLGASPVWNNAEIVWGQSAKAELRGIHWSPPRLSVDNARLSGDLTSVLRSVPDLGNNKWVNQWIDFRRWRIEGPFSLALEPQISLRVDKATLDSGRGLTGPITFTYSGEDRAWTFVSPTIQLDLRKFIGEIGFGDYPIEGFMLANADLRGVLPASGSPGGGWLRSGVINGRVESARGDLGPPGRRVAPWMGWRGLGGEVQATWNAEASKLIMNLFAQEWIFHTKPGSGRAGPSSLSTPARLECLIVKATDQVYDVRYVRALLGENSPIQLDVKGSVTRGRTAWIPQLKVRGQADRARPTPVFRGIRVGGTGSLNGEIQGTPAGSWVFSGDLDCSGFLYEQVAVPILLRDVRNKLMIREVNLDELMSADKWRRSGFEIPNPPDKTDSLETAFAQSRETPENLAIGEARIGRTDYRDLTVRCIVKGEVLYLVTIQGKFAQGGYPFQATGFSFAVPGSGAGWRLRGKTGRVPLNLGVPGFEPWFKLQDEALEVDFYITRTPPNERVETRYLKLAFPLSRLKDIPRVGNLLFGWTPDSLGEDVIIFQRVGDGEWHAINPFRLPDAQEIPTYLRNLPRGVVREIEDKGSGFIRSVGEGIRDVFRSQ